MPECNVLKPIICIYIYIYIHYIYIYITISNERPSMVIGLKPSPNVSYLWHWVYHWNLGTLNPSDCLALVPGSCFSGPANGQCGFPCLRSGVALHARCGFLLLMESVEVNDWYAIRLDFEEVLITATCAPFFPILALLWFLGLEVQSWWLGLHRQGRREWLRSTPGWWSKKGLIMSCSGDYWGLSSSMN